MLCEERMHLIEQYSKATFGYAESVKNLRDLIHLGADDEPARRFCRAAWEECERARIALALHEGNHYCDSKKA